MLVRLFPPKKMAPTLKQEKIVFGEQKRTKDHNSDQRTSDATLVAIESTIGNCHIRIENKHGTA